MTIRLARCTLRPWRSGDEESLVRHADNRKIWRNLRDAFPHPYRPEDARAWIEMNAGVAPVRHFAIEVDGAAVGSVGVTALQDVYRRSGEIGYWLGEAFWGRGIMTEAVQACTAYAFATFDGARLHAHVYAWNQASMRVLEKAGYQREGWLRASVWKDGQLADSALYAHIRDLAG